MRNFRVNPTKENDPTFKYLERGTPKYLELMSYGGGHETQEKLAAAFVAQSYGDRGPLHMHGPSIQRNKRIEVQVDHTGRGRGRGRGRGSLVSKWADLLVGVERNMSALPIA
ncbi:hypothetical protein V6N13_052682 [Hibiscus sabdariffa]|uniref:Uncharacterized protein n=2 Tax=Hibiscus sabdariffa TaxID=183260 RepID=A0ABR2Q5L7_9ROSI